MFRLSRDQLLPKFKTPTRPSKVGALSCFFFFFCLDNTLWNYWADVEFIIDVECRQYSALRFPKGRLQYDVLRDEREAYPQEFPHMVSKQCIWWHITRSYKRSYRSLGSYAFVCHLKINKKLIYLLCTMSH